MGFLSSFSTILSVFTKIAEDLNADSNKSTRSKLRNKYIRK